MNGQKNVLELLNLTEDSPPPLVAERVAQHLKTGDVSYADAISILDILVLQPNVPAQARVFGYEDELDPTEPGCTPSFVRSFIHTDWIDGESVVQAGETTGEEGFNTRFHKLEADLDTMHSDVAKAFLCLGELREQLAALLGEVKDEINRINADVAAGGGGDAQTLGGHPASDFALSGHDHDTRYMRNVHREIGRFANGESAVYGPFDEEPHLVFTRYSYPDGAVPQPTHFVVGAQTPNIRVRVNKQPDGGFLSYDYTVHVENLTGQDLWILTDVYAEE